MIIDRCRNIEEFKEVHSKCKNERIPTAESILALNDYCFCFYDEETAKLLGCIYLENDNGKTCLSGFSLRKNYYKVLEAIKFISHAFKNIDLYSMTDKPSAKIVLSKCGFKKIGNEVYLRKAY